MNDQELFSKFEKYAREHGLNAEQAAARIGAKRASYFNWKNGKAISSKARAAMIALTLESEDKHSCALEKCPAEKPVDHFMQVILECWEFLSEQEKGQIAGEVSSFAKNKKELFSLGWRIVKNGVKNKMVVK